MRHGWFQHSFEHSLARRGIPTQKYRQRYPKLIKPFKGQNPRLTVNYARFRQAAPSSFVQGTFRTKRVTPNKSIIVAKQKRDQKFGLQSVLIKRNDYMSMKRSEVRSVARRVAGALSKDAARVEIAGSLRRGMGKDAKDADIVVIPKNVQSKEVMRKYLRRNSTIIYQDGKEKFAGHIKGVKTEIYFSEPDEFGAQLMRATGPAGANIQKSALAREKGMKLSQHGLFRGKKRIAVSERAIYKNLGLTYRRPELRGTPRT